MERSQIKQRIVGGLVLVALGAIVIPFLLDMHQADQWWGKGNIPKKPENGFVTRVLPLEEWSNQAQSELAEGTRQLNAHAPAAKGAGQSPPPPVTAPQAPTPSPSLAPATAAVASKPASAPSSTPAAAMTSGAEAGLEGWVVQLGSFSSEKNAEELRERLQKKGYRVFVEHIKQGGQTAYRVRIGPEQQRAAAEAIRDQLVHDLKLKAIVLHIP